VAFTDLHEIGEMFDRLSCVFDVFERDEFGESLDRAGVHVTKQSWARGLDTDERLNGPAAADKREWKRERRKDPEYRAHEQARESARRAWRLKNEPGYRARVNKYAAARAKSKYHSDPELRQKRIEYEREWKRRKRAKLRGEA
jgi:hypothetical protein